jgi:hypothetical protein
MNVIAILVALYNGAKVISPVVLAVASGLGMILTKALGWGISEIFQALALIFSGASVSGLNKALAELSALTHGTGTTPAAGTGTTPAAKAE